MKHFAIKIQFIKLSCFEKIDLRANTGKFDRHLVGITWRFGMGALGGICIACWCVVGVFSVHRIEGQVHLKAELLLLFVAKRLIEKIHSAHNTATNQCK